MAEKPTEAVFNDRVHSVYTDLINGKRRAEILRYASTWGVTDRTIDNYISRANDLLEQEAETVRERELGKALARYNAIYKAAIEAGDLKLALDVQKEISRLLGLMAPTQTEISGLNGGPLVIKGYMSVSPDEWTNAESTN
jgi:hypothetical protein